jgi:hypothetical protein
VLRLLLFAKEPDRPRCEAASMLLCAKPTNCLDRVVGRLGEGVVAPEGIDSAQRMLDEWVV